MEPQIFCTLNFHKIVFFKQTKTPMIAYRRAVWTQGIKLIWVGNWGIKNRNKSYLQFNDSFKIPNHGMLISNTNQAHNMYMHTSIRD